MTVSSADAQLFTQACQAAAEAFLATLAGAPVGSPVPVGPVKFDPRVDAPPGVADPKGSATERNLAFITYLGAVWLVNEQEGRGATAEEVAQYAKAAGYQNGRAVNGFSVNSASTEQRKDGRWVTDGGAVLLKELAAEAHLGLPGMPVG